MAVTFEWDPEKAATNLGKHGVHFDEASRVFADPLGRIVDDPRHSRGEDRFVLIGFSQAQRLLAVMFAETRNRIRIISAQSLAPKGEHMKKPRAKPKAVREVDRDEILPEYYFSEGRRNKYAARYVEGTNLVLLDPDVAKEFPDSNAVNKALREFSAMIRRRKPRRTV